MRHLLASVVSYVGLGCLGWAAPFGTSFTYQGRLQDGANPATGLYEWRFALYDDPIAGNQAGFTLTNLNVGVTNGAFTTWLDFGPLFTGAAYWLELGVRTNGSASDFATLAPRQRVSPTPYSLYASAAGGVPAAGLTGLLPDTQLSTNIARLNGSNQVFSGPLALTSPNNLVIGRFGGEGAGLSGVDLQKANAFGAITWSSNFNVASTLNVTNKLSWTALADLNNDGRLDLACTFENDPYVAVYTNNGGGGFAFATATRNVSGSGMRSVAILDLNNDGRPDLVVGEQRAVTLLTNNGLGRFVLASSLAVAEPPNGMPESLRAVDLNKDGYLDLVCATSGAFTNSLTILTNNQRGGLALATRQRVSKWVHWVAVADLNNDTWPDLISTGNLDYNLTLLTNDTRGGFGTNAFLPLANMPSSVTALDVNADGWVDLITTDIGSTNGGLTILTNNARGGFALAASLSFGLYPSWVTPLELNGDGKVDLVCATSAGFDLLNNSAGLLALTNTGRGGFALAYTITAGSPDAWGPVVTLEMNGDARPDVVCAGTGFTLLVLTNSPYAGANFVGNGAGLIGLNASQLTSGTVSLARLPAEVVTNFETGVTLGGTFSGNGAGLTNLNVSSLAGGTFTNAITFNPAAGAPFGVGNTTKVTNLNADLLDGLSAGAFWQITGNAGTTAGANYLGTLDNQALEFKVNATRALRLEPNATSPNVIGGFAGNYVGNGAYGATVAGGGATALAAGTNLATGSYATVSGGANNRATDLYATVGGGGGNAATNDYATVPGGAGNLAGGAYSFAAGRRAKANYAGSFVWADHQNADFADTATDQFLIRASGGVGIGTTNLNGLLTMQGSRGGNYAFPLAYFENANLTGNSGPTLRVTSYGNAVDGVLNISAFGTGKILALGGNGGEVANFETNGTLTLEGGLVFGGGSGEMIFSRRTAGPNRYGLDLCTGFNSRLSIDNGGNVGLGTLPAAKLDVETGAGRLQFRSEGGLCPGLNIAGSPNAGVLRFRNALEIWPSDDGANAGRLDVRDTNGTATIQLNGGSGEATVKILNITGGSDLAEPFAISDDHATPGTVVVIDEDRPGQLKLSHRAYDTRVAGIVSGANGVNPGLTLRQEGRLGGGRNVALTGRVYALADASTGAIKPGDLLTTSDTPGHCMKAGDPTQAPGAILGKAMSGLKEGRGLVLVLVSLQ